MLNYIKFATYQVIGFTSSIPLMNKILKNPNNYSNTQKFEYLHKHANKSLNLVNINLNIKGRGKIPNEPVLFVVNHSSMLDSFILFASVDRPIGCVIADEPVWRNMPIVNKWTQILNCVYINRENNREGIKSINQAAENIKSGHSMAIFPEGDLTWVKDPNALVSEFRSGALKIAYKAKCPIVPIVIKNSRNTYEGYQPVGKIHSTDVEIEFLNPICDHLDDPKIKSTYLSDKIQNLMIDCIKEYNSKI